MTENATTPLAVSSHEENLTINTFLQHSYDSAMKQIGSGVSFIKDEFNHLVERTGGYLVDMMSPVNNFLKDLTQIDADFQQAETMAPARNNGCTIIPIEIALLSPMEENY